MKRNCLILAFGALLLAVAPYANAAAAPDHVRGRILLDVEHGGEAWYVSPVSGFRYSLGDPSHAFEVMRMFGVGITRADLSRVATSDAPFDTDERLLPHVRGRILLDVERDGAAWYVDPTTGRRHALGGPWQALRVMGDLGLGISSRDLAAIDRGEPRGGAVLHHAAFVPQAPFGEWWDLRQSEGCEEAVALMAVRWAHGQGIGYDEARDAIIAAAEYQRTRYGSYEDTSTADTADRIFREHFDFDRITVRTGIDVDDIVDELHRDRVVGVNVDARYLGNPFFSDPPPVQHMILVLGYDPLADQFIAHDPGTRRGGYIRYDAAALRRSLLDYPTGFREPLPDLPASLISVSRASPMLSLHP